MSPSEALAHTISSIWIYKDRFPGPGKLVERMNPDIREALSRLTSDDDALKVPKELVKGLVPSADEPLAYQKANNDQLFAEQMKQKRAHKRARLMFDAKLKQN